MNSDQELLRRYAVERDEDAFAELVRRYLKPVSSVALRVGRGDPHLADDVTSRVFTDLARKAGEVCRGHSLGGWLHKSTQFAVAKVLRGEARRRDRESAALELYDMGGEVDATWEEVRLVLDEAMAELREQDRNAVRLRYLDGRPFAEIAKALGVSENAARMRTDRALDRLRVRLGVRGITSGAAALDAMLVNRRLVPETAADSRRLRRVVAGALQAGRGRSDRGDSGMPIGEWLRCLGWVGAAIAVVGVGWYRSEPGAAGGLKEDRLSTLNAAAVWGASEAWGGSDGSPRNGSHAASTAVVGDRLRVLGDVRYQGSRDKVATRFTVSPGWLVPGASGQWRADWSESESGMLPFFDGVFEWEWVMDADSATHGARKPILRVDVPGCASKVVGPFDWAAGEIRVEAVVRRGNEQLIQVIQPDGLPAVDAEVVVAREGATLRLMRGEFRKWRSMGRQFDGDPFFRTTDRDGCFSLIPEEAEEPLLVAHRSGYGWVTAAQARADRVIRLRAPGAIEGRWMSGGRPVTNRVVYARLDATRLGFPGQVTDIEAFLTRTDSEGHFSIPQLPAGPWLLFGLGAEGSARLAVDRWTACSGVEVSPGATAVVSMGGAEVRFRLAEVRFRLEGGAGALEATSNRVWAVLEPLTGFRETNVWEGLEPGLGGSGSVEAVQTLQVGIGFERHRDGEGVWVAEGAKPGPWQIRVSVVEPHSLTVLAEARGRVRIPEMPEGGVIDLGVLTLEPRVLGDRKSTP